MNDVMYPSANSRHDAVLWLDEKTGMTMCLLIDDYSGAAKVYPAGSVSGVLAVDEIENAQVYVFRNAVGVTYMRIRDDDSKLRFFGPVVEPKLYQDREVGILKRETER